MVVDQSLTTRSGTIKALMFTQHLQLLLIDSTLQPTLILVLLTRSKCNHATQLDTVLSQVRFQSLQHKCLHNL